MSSRPAGSWRRAVARNFNARHSRFLALAPLSAAWSIDPSATLLRFVSLATIVLVCFAISLGGWQPPRFQQVALPPLMTVLLVSLVVGMIYAGSNHGDRYRHFAERMRGTASRTAKMNSG